MKTLQMMDYDFENIILYKVIEVENEKHILVFTDMKEQLNKYLETKNINDAPIGFIDYSVFNINEIITKMKKIHNYKLLDDSVLVYYEDDTSYNFNLDEVDTIESILNEQRKNSLKVNKINIDKNDIIDTIKDNVLDNLASIIAGIEFNYNDKEIDPKILFNNKYLKVIDQKDDKTNKLFIDEGKKLFDYLNNDDSFKKYKDAIGIDFDEQLSSEIVQIINGYYPIILTHMSLEDYKTEIMGCLNVMATFLTSKICQSNTGVDISEYIHDESDKVLINTVLNLANNIVNYLINAKLFDVEHYLNEVNLDNDFIEEERQKFNRQYINPFDELLNYMYDTLTGVKYKELNIGIKTLLLYCFKILGSLIPENSFIKNEDINDVVYFKYYKKGDKDYYPRNNKFKELEFFNNDEIITIDEMIELINNDEVIELGISTFIDNELDKNIKLLLSVSN